MNNILLVSLSRVIKTWQGHCPLSVPFKDNFQQQPCFYVFFLCTPEFNDLYPLVIFQNAYFISSHVNVWLILYLSAKVALKLVQKLDHDKQYKMYLLEL